jgi:hypothetical protein
MRTTRPPVVDWLSLALRPASSATSTSTTATIQASYATAPDFFNSLLGLASSGMNKLAAILLGMTEQSGGVILVDEIENGTFEFYRYKGNLTVTTK